MSKKPSILYYPIQSLNPTNGYKPSFKRFWGMGECLYEWVVDRGYRIERKGANM